MSDYGLKALYNCALTADLKNVTFQGSFESMELGVIDRAGRIREISWNASDADENGD